MTLDEAIAHAEEVAKEQDKLCKSMHPAEQLSDYEKCAEDHRQLAEWLKELMQLREQREQAEWIPVSKRLPEEKINPITEDFYEYQCTYHAYGVYDVRSYKFGNGHWWHGPGIMDDSVIAWMPLPKPYKAESEEV